MNASGGEWTALVLLHLRAVFKSLTMVSFLTPSSIGLAFVEKCRHWYSLDIVLCLGLLLFLTHLLVKYGVPQGIVLELLFVFIQWSYFCFKWNQLQLLSSGEMLKILLQTALQMTQMMDKRIYSIKLQNKYNFISILERTINSLRK